MQATAELNTRKLSKFVWYSGCRGCICTTSG